MPSIHTENLTLAYDKTTVVVNGVNLRIPEGQITSVIGPNGCGKSTLLRAISRLLKPQDGAVILDGKAVHAQPTREVAKCLAILPQQPVAPESITVEDLVRRGRYPHQSAWQPYNSEDRWAVEKAMSLAGVAEMRAHLVDELSGGQRQRVWIAMVLAQRTPVLLLDEPTTFLDMAHRHEVLELVSRLNREEDRTVVMVLHDINDAAAVSDHVVAMKDGAIVVEGRPDAVLKPDLIESVFGVKCDSIVDSHSGRPVYLPRSCHDRPVAEAAETTGIALETRELATGYGRRPIVRDVSVEIPRGKVTAIVGPNGCGKSTLLRSIARLLNPIDGEVLLEAAPVWELSNRMLGRKVALLHQDPGIPPDITVEDLVALGRRPHQRWFRQWSTDDETAVDTAMTATAVADLRSRPVESLSGGQRQRAWLAMAIAQDTQILILDEPTTFLDIASQVEVLEQVRESNVKSDRTVIMVLHDLNQACRYADFMIAMDNGRVVSMGAPERVVTRDLLFETFGVSADVAYDPVTGRPLVLPHYMTNRTGAENHSSGDPGADLLSRQNLSKPIPAGVPGGSA